MRAHKRKSFQDTTHVFKHSCGHWNDADASRGGHEMKKKEDN